MTDIYEIQSGDARADKDTQYTLTLGTTFWGRFDAASDVDWIRLELTAGTVYEIIAWFTYSDSALVKLVDSEGNEHAYGNGRFFRGPDFTFTPPVTGDYYLSVYGTNNTSDTYQIFISDEYEIPLNTLDDLADYLTDGYWEWRGETRRAFNVEPGGTLTANITALTAEGQQLARWALEAWAGVSGIEFEFVEGENAQIIFDDDGDKPVTTSTVDDGVIIHSRVNIPSDWLVEYGATVNSFSFATYLHEIGHALGLGHPGPYPDAIDHFHIDYADRLFQNDSFFKSVMSSFSTSGMPYDPGQGSPNLITPMIADIIAIQNLYGAPTDTNAGDTVYGFQSNVGGYMDELFTLATGENNPLLGFGPDPNVRTLDFIDLDDDGDLDLVAGGVSRYANYFENTGSAGNPVFTQRFYPDNPVYGIEFYGSEETALADLDGDGDLDLITITRNFRYFENTGTAASPEFTKRTGASNPMDGINVGSDDLPHSNILPALTDLDDDGDLDLIVGVENGDTDYYENTGSVSRPDFVQHTGAANPLDNVKVEFASELQATDIDGDNDPDLILMGRNGTIRYFENTGTPALPGFTERTGAANPFEGIEARYTATFALADIDGDQDIDLVIPGFMSYLEFYENIGTRTNPDFRPAGPRISATQTLYDSGGNDTLDLSTDFRGKRVDLRPEQSPGVFGIVAIAPGTIIENAIGSGDDHIIGNTAANRLYGGAGNDHLWGNKGDDILDGGPDADNLYGGAGVDTVSYQGSNAGVMVNLETSTGRGGHADYDSIHEVENIIGSAHDDELVGDGFANRLYGADGDDVLRGGAGDDVLEGGAGADEMDGGAGTDWLSYEGSDTAVSVRLWDGQAGRGHAEGDTFSGIENIRGSVYGDLLSGDARANRLRGGAGNDQMWGGSGNDVLDGGPGADRFYGGPGVDWITYGGSDAGVTVDLGEGTGEGGHAQGDVIAEVENVRGSVYPDVLVGDDSANRLYGGDGADELRGRGGDDLLEGAAGADRLDGGGGMDRVSYLRSDRGVTVNLADGTGDTLARAAMLKATPSLMLRTWGGLHTGMSWLVTIAPITWKALAAMMSFGAMEGMMNLREEPVMTK